MSRRMAQASLFGVALLIGVLLVAQLRSQARPIELSSLSAQELSTLIDTLSTRNVELADSLAALREQIRTYEGDQAVGQSRLELAEEELRRVKAFAGTMSVRGQGIAIGVEGSLDPTAVNDLVQELRNAGAEAIAIDEIRVAAPSVAVLGTGSIEIDGVPIGRSFEVRAIGAPAGLRAALVRPGGILALLEQRVEGVFRVDERANLVLPATERDLAPRAARSVE